MPSTLAPSGERLDVLRERQPCAVFVAHEERDSA